jgi:hypothetical protein
MEYHNETYYFICWIYNNDTLKTDDLSKLLKNKMIWVTIIQFGSKSFSLKCILRLLNLLLHINKMGCCYPWVNCGGDGVGRHSCCIRRLLIYKAVMCLLSWAFQLCSLISKNMGQIISEKSWILYKALLEVSPLQDSTTCNIFIGSFVIWLCELGETVLVENLQSLLR